MVRLESSATTDYGKLTAETLAGTITAVSEEFAKRIGQFEDKRCTIEVNIQVICTEAN